jgi:hypothetical protein
MAAIATIVAAELKQIAKQARMGVRWPGSTQECAARAVENGAERDIVRWREIADAAMTTLRDGGQAVMGSRHALATGAAFAALARKENAQSDVVVAARNPAAVVWPSERWGRAATGKVRAALTGRTNALIQFLQTAIAQAL